MDVQEGVELPSAFEDVEIDHLAILIADMLYRLIDHNDKIPLLPESLTRFHSRSPPAITVLDYLRRIIKFTNVEKSCLLLILYCIDRVCARKPSFTISSLTCHRFIISSITICSKGICDSFCSNSIYAKVGGVTIAELNLLEREFLQFTDWRIVCTRDVLQEYYISLVRTHSKGSYTLAPSETTDVCVSDTADTTSRNTTTTTTTTTENANLDPHSARIDHESSASSSPTMMDPSAVPMAMNTDYSGMNIMERSPSKMQVDGETDLTGPQRSPLKLSPQTPRGHPAMSPDYTSSPGRHLRRAREERDDDDPDEEERQRRRRRRPLDTSEQRSPVDFIM